MKAILLGILLSSNASMAQPDTRLFDGKGKLVDVARDGASVITMDDRGRPLHLDGPCFSDTPSRVVISIVRADKSINGHYAGTVVVNTTAGKCFYKSSSMFVRLEGLNLIYHGSYVKGAVKSYKVFRKSSD